MPKDALMNSLKLSLSQIKSQDLRSGYTPILGFNNGNGKSYVGIVFPLLVKSSETQGLVSSTAVMAVVSANIFQYIMDRQKAFAENVMVFNDQGYAIGHTNSEYAGKKIEEASLRALIKEGRVTQATSSFIQDSDGQKFTVREMIPKSNLLVISQIKKSDLVAGQWSHLLQLVLLGVGLILIISVAFEKFNVNAELKKTMQAELNDEIRNELKNEMRFQLKSELRQELKQEIREEMKSEWGAENVSEKVSGRPIENQLISGAQDNQNEQDEQDEFVMNSKEGHNALMINNKTIPQNILKSPYVDNQNDLVENKISEIKNKKDLNQSYRKLVSALSHEISAPLAAILGHVRMGMRSLSLEKMKNHFENIEFEVNRSRSFMEKLQDFSGDKVSHKSEKIELKHTLTKLLETWMISFEKEGIQIENEVPERIFITTSQQHFEKVINSLLQNAIEAMSGVYKKNLKFKANVDNGKVFLDIEDTGEGMTEDVLMQAMNPFFTTKVSSSHMGLGLSVVHGILKENRGDIQIESRQRVGTCITLQWPEFSETEMIIEEEFLGDDKKGHLNVAMESFSLSAVSTMPLLSQSLEEMLELPPLEDATSLNVNNVMPDIIEEDESHKENGANSLLATQWPHQNNELDEDLNLDQNKNKIKPPPPPFVSSISVEIKETKVRKQKRTFDLPDVKVVKAPSKIEHVSPTIRRPRAKKQQEPQGSDTQDV
jgi:C4-dicarboxylate-specific signal transduction histidine kinase